jgi:hypothetical protein
MGLREGVNQHRGIAVGATCALIVVALVMTAMQMRRGSVAAQGAPSGRFFYSADDGKTWFVDDSTKIPPFLKDGKEAVRAYVYRTKDGKEFVGLLERYSPAGKKMLDAAAALPPDPLRMEDNSMAAAEALQWKKPGQKTWVSANDPRAANVTTVVSPNGASDTVTPVTPG